MAEAERERLGLLSLNNRCSASLLTNEWAVTASHCISVADTSDPSRVTVTANWGTPPQARAADRFYRLWGVGDGNADAYDQDPVAFPRAARISRGALLHVTQPFPVNGSTATYRRELTALGLRDMVGQTVDEYGRGIHDYDQASPNGPVMVQRDGR